MKLQSIEFKNIMSFGNNTTKLELNNNQINLLRAPNGSGKSSIIEAFHFALSGKPYRNINKDQLVNWTNGRNCLVNLNLECNNDVYNIKRGIKPNLFEIYKNESLKDEDAHVRDYQKVLDDLLKVNFKTLKQTIIVSSTFYKPFLEMSKAQKREYIENILNLNDFSNMNEEVKKRLKLIKTKKLVTEKEIEKFESNLEILNNLEIDKSENIESKKKELNAIIVTLKKEIISTEQEKTTLENEAKEKKAANEAKLNKYKRLRIEFQDKRNKCENLIYNLKKKVKEFELDTCPTCKQDLPKKQRTEKLKESNTKLEKYTEAFKKINTKLDAIDNILIECKNTRNEICSIEKDISKLVNSINIKNYKIESNIKELNVLNKPVKDNSDKISSLKKSVKEESVKLRKINKRIYHYTVIQKLLADDGIKRYVVRKYLSIFNSLVNKYLEILGTFFKIKFDEEFNETILAYGNNNKATYTSFSSGQKQRVNFAMLFAFLELAKKRNSIDINCLFLDEILDSALDESGISSLFKILEYLKNEEGYTIYIISHRKEIENLFDKIYKIEYNTFSKLIEET